MKSQNKGEKGISPTIGVILMVAIAVIIAAVVATTVLGIGGATEKPPEATFDVRYEPDPGPSYYDEIVITHETGESFDISEIEIAVSTPGGEARLTSLPVPNSRKESSLDPPSNADLNDIYTTGKDGLFQGGTVWGGLAYGGTEDAGTKWEPGNRLVIPLDISVAYPGSGGLDEEDRVEVTVFDKDKGQIIGSEEIAPTEFLR
jgi:flagellin-like protein